MNLKQEIKIGEAITTEHKKILTDIEDLLQKGSSAEMVVFLMDLKRIDYEEKIAGNEKYLAELKQKQLVQFEADSAICNRHIDTVIAAAKKLDEAEPLEISVKLYPLVDAYNDDLPQTEKNDIYEKLVFLINQINMFNA